MANYRPINTGEGELYITPGRSCESPFGKMRICACGTVTFLEGPCRKRGCGKMPVTPVSRMLEKQFKDEMGRKMRNQWLLLFMRAVLLFIYLEFMLIIFSRDNIFALGLFKKAIMVVAAVLITAGLLVQTLDCFKAGRMLRETKKCKYGSQVIPAYVLAHSVSPLARSYTLEERSESWFNVMLHAYKEDIAYLGNQLENARFGGDSENKLREVYESAMTLSYVTDCTELADLRLRCLMEIGLRPNSHSDIEQILHVIPADHFERNPSSLYLIEKCLAMYSEPLSKWSVSCIMYDLKHFVLYSSEREVVKKCLKHCSGGKVRWFKSAYSYMLQGDEAAWSWLENCIESLIKEDRVFEMQYNAAA